MNKRLGVIDIGTLKVKCQIVEVRSLGKIKTIEQSNNMTFLGEGKVKETIQELKHCKDIFEKYGVSKTRIVSTHALREMGEKGKEIAGKIKKEVGFNVEIISAQEEANLFFKAVLSDFKTDDDFAIIDVGAGSVQILIGNKNKLKNSFLLKTGTMTLWNKFVSNHNGSYAPTFDQISMRQFVVKELESVPSGLKTPIIYGSSCIIEVFSGIRIPIEKFTKSKSHPHKAQLSHLNQFLEKVWPLSYDEREKRYESPTPKYMWGIDCALINVLELAKKVDAPYIIPSNANINQGLIKSLL